MEDNKSLKLLNLWGKDLFWNFIFIFYLIFTVWCIVNVLVRKDEYTRKIFNIFTINISPVNYVHGKEKYINTRLGTQLCMEHKNQPTTLKCLNRAKKNIRFYQFSQSKKLRQRNWVFATNSHFIIPISLYSNLS